MFYEKQSEEQRETYVRLLRAVGSLSNLFTDSKIPYLYYRAAENIFCESFGAMNLSRGDVSADAAKNGIGIGLKTFLHGNGRTAQKVAEFNKDLPKYQGKEAEEIVEIISSLRNERIKFTLRAHKLESMMYHLVTRSEEVFSIFEEEMHLIDEKTIKVTSDDGKSIYFEDAKSKYRFYRAKSTLFKVFKVDVPLDSFVVKILENPFEVLGEKTLNEVQQASSRKQYEYIYLPLYSTQRGDGYGKVAPKSGLNAWNASDENRARKPNEVYIPIPAFIRKQYPDFFPWDENAEKKGIEFELILPNGEKMNASRCQADGKALMSNPNGKLGEWILRDVFQLNPHELATNEILERLGIDSVKVTKFDEMRFRIDFAEIGSFEEFKSTFEL